MLSTQAIKVAKPFGGLTGLAKAIGKNPSTVHRWSYPKDRGGTDGRIPTVNVPEIIAAADLLGYIIPAEAWIP